MCATGVSGTLLWRDNRTPFGEPWGPQDPANDNSPGFTGHIEDTATGLTYMQARYYNPAWARFLSNDPVSFSPERPYMFGRCTYAANDPIKFIHPDGRQICGASNANTCTDEITVFGQRPPDQGPSLGNIIIGIFTGNSVPGRASAQEIQDFVDDGLEQVGDDAMTAAQCAANQTRLDALAGAGIAASGLPVIPTRGKFGGATPGTSPASVAARSTLGNARFPGGARVWAPTVRAPLATSAKVGTAAGRLAPGLGYGLLARDLAGTMDCINQGGVGNGQ